MEYAELIDTRDVYSSMLEDVRRRLYDGNVKVGKRKNKLEEMQLVDKLSNNLALNIDLRNVKLLSELSNLLSNLKAYGKVGIKIPTNLKTNIEELSSMIHENELEQLENVISSSFKHAKNTQKKLIKSDLAKIRRIMNQLDLYGKKMPLNSDFEQYQSMYYKTAIDKIENDFTKVELPKINYNKKPQKTYMPSVEENMIFDIVHLRSSGAIGIDKNSELISKNLFDIRNAFMARTKLVNVIKKIVTIVTSIDEVVGIDTGDIKSFLLRLESKYSRELAKIEKYLSKYDFSEIKSRIAGYKEVKRLSAAEEYKIAVYEGLSYELAMMEELYPEDKDRIRDLNRQMSSFAVRSGLTSYQLEAASENGVRRYKFSVVHDKEVPKDNNEKVESSKLLREYYDFCKNNKNSSLTFAEYVRSFHGVEGLDSIVLKDEEVKFGR